MNDLLKSYLTCGLLSMSPIVELRGAIPMGAAMGLPPIPLTIICIVCNVIPVALIILFIRKLLLWMKKRGGFLAKTSQFVDDYARKKQSMYHRYALWGLLLLVAVPLPGTGAWTGALLTAILDIRLKYAMPVIFAGVVVAGILVCAITYGIKFILG